MVSDTVVNSIWEDYEKKLNSDPVYKAEEERLFQEKTGKPLSEFETETKLMFKKTAKARRVYV